MRLLLVLDPLDSLKAYKDTSVAMMRAAQARGHAVWACEQQHVHWRDARVSSAATRLSVTDNDEDWYRAHETEVRALADFDAVLMRKDPPFDLGYVETTWLLSAAERDGARVFNAPDAIRNHNEKLSIAEFPRFTVPSLATRDMAEGIGPAIRSGVRAAQAILDGKPYRLDDVTGASLGGGWVSRGLDWAMTRGLAA